MSATLQIDQFENNNALFPSKKPKIIKVQIKFVIKNK